MKPLAGRTVVITRSADHAAAMSELVTSFGARPVVVPLIRIVDEPDGLAGLTSLDLSVDWIVITSPNGAERLTRRIPPGDASPRLAAVGSTTAAALPRCDLVAETQGASGLLEMFPPGPGRVVVVQAVDAEPTMVHGLRDLGWIVTAISPYRTVAAAPTAEQQHAALAADAVLFASGSAARAWVGVFGMKAPAIVVAIGEQTAAAAERAGLKVSAVSADHSTYGMLDTLSRYFSDLK
jgi:uroporphyrinogen III methyltransferase / synthase